MDDQAVNTLAVYVNWKRSANGLPILTALRNQSVPLHICVIECAPSPEFALPPEAISLADTVFTVNRNFGPSSRFIPALAFTEYRYVYFQVDDHLPGEDCVWWFLECAKKLDDQFATLGQDGRHIDPLAQAIIKRKVRQAEDRETFTPVDVVTSSELVRADYIDAAIAFRWNMLEKFGSDVSLFEDDLFLCFGIQQYSGWPSYVIPCGPVDRNTTWAKRKLHAPHALCARPDHQELRNKFIRQAMACGWKPIWREPVR